MTTYASKAECIRWHISEYPGIKPKELSAMASTAFGSPIKASEISFYRTKSKTAAPKKGKPGRKPKAQQEENGTVVVSKETIKDPVRLIAAVKDLIQAAGGAAKAKQLIELMS